MIRRETKKLCFWVWVLNALLCGSVSAAADYPWELQKDEEGITVYTRKVEGSPVLEFRGETIIDVPVEKAAAFYEQENRITEWFHRAKESRLIKKVSDTESLVYFAADLPWPFFDRDGIYQRMRSVDPATGAVIYELHSAPDDYPPQKRRVRIVYLDAEWRFTPLPDGRTQVNCRTHTAPGGYIPPALLNRFVISLPFKTLHNLRSLLNNSDQETQG